MQMHSSGFCPICQTDYSYFLEIPTYQRVLHCLVLVLCLAVQWAGLALANMDLALDGSAEALSQSFLLYAIGWLGATPGMLVAGQHLQFRWQNR